MRKVKKDLGALYVHIFPKNDVSPDGQPVIHDIISGVSCWCEPICEASYFPKNEAPLYVVVHRQERFKVVISTIKISPRPEEPPPGASDTTPPPKWTW